MRKLIALLSLVLSAGYLPAQLLPDQRTFDFQNLAALYAKRYAPYIWKQKAFNVDLLDIKPWLDRVRAAKDDLEFFEIQAEYVASFQDTHSYSYMQSTFSANLGITVDIYDGKVLIDSINRARLSATAFPFVVGDELVSVDGKSVEDWITLLSKWRKFGNPATTRRNAAASITLRSQSTYPRAVEVGDTSKVVIRRASGAMETYDIPWAKSGVPIVKVGPVPMPRAAVSKASAADSDLPGYVRLLEELHTWKLPDYDPALQTLDWPSEETGDPRRFVNGLGSRTPIFRLPDTFVQRLGRVAADFHYSGVYTSGGKSIGYIRVPSFGPTNQAAAIAELETEITFMQKNTDGLVVDVMRNPGGGCYMYDLAAHLIPYPFYFFGEEVRATQDRVNSYQAIADSARSVGVDSWIVAAYQSFADTTRAAFVTNRGMTSPIPACGAFRSSWPPTDENNLPAAIVYTKPLIILVDEFSISAADIFPSMMQDNARGVLVGMGTSGGGGSVSAWPTGYYSESVANNTNSLVVRARPIVTAEYPTARYVENIGARPDIKLDYMTRDNLLNAGRTFVDQFTAILLDKIQTGN